MPKKYQQSIRVEFIPKIVKQTGSDNCKQGTYISFLWEMAENLILYPSLWKLTTHITLTQPTEKKPGDRFNLTGLNPNLALSDNAKDFKKLFETFQKTNSPTSHSMMEWVLHKNQIT